jgi:hypothetical protein
MEQKKNARKTASVLPDLTAAALSGGLSPLDLGLNYHRVRRAVPTISHKLYV